MSDEVAPPHPEFARTTPRLLLDPSFGPFFAAKVGTAIGVWISNIVAAVVVFRMTESALLVGAVSAAQFLPQVALGPLAGSRADRGDRLRLLVTGRLISAGSAGALAIWVGAVGMGGTAGAAPVIFAAFLIGVGFAIASSAMHAIVPALVRPSELSTAIALVGTPHTIARAAGPAIGALILTFAGPGAAFAVAAATFALDAGVSARSKLRPMPDRMGGDRSVRAGLRYLRSDRPSALLLAGVATVGLGADPVLTLTPPLAAQLNGGDQLVGWLVSAFGLGSAAVIVLMTPIRNALGIITMTPVGLAFFAAGYVLVAFSPTPGLALIGLLVAGAGMMCAITSLTTQLQVRLPEEFRGRIMALWGVAFLGSRPVAAAINGGVADLVSVRAALLVTVAVLLGGAVVARPVRTQSPR